MADTATKSQDPIGDDKRPLLRGTAVDDQSFKDGGEPGSFTN